MTDTDHDELSPGSSSYVLAKKLQSIVDKLERILSNQENINLRMDRMEADWGLAMNALVQVNIRMAQKEEADRLQALIDRRFPPHSFEHANEKTPNTTGTAE